METITDVALAEIQAEVHGSKTKRELTDKLDGLPGVIMARIAADKVDFYYKFQWEKKRELLHLGIYSPRVRKDRITLPQAFDDVIKHAEIRSHGKNPKDVIRQEKEEQEAGLRRRIKQAEIQGFGTFGRLLMMYEDSIINPDTKADVKSTFKRIRDQLPELLTLQARDIEWDHLKPVFQTLLDEGKGAMANHVLSYAKAAFNKVMKIELDTSMLIDAKDEFGLIANPLQYIKENRKYKNAGKTEWSEAEIAAVWHNAVRIKGPITGRFVRFIIATAGQRLNQTIRVPWQDYRLDSETPYFEIGNMKKKRGGVETPHIVPLNPLAMAEIEVLRDITGHCDYPFAGRIGSGLNPHAPLASRRLNSVMTQICKETNIRNITLGATRTTCKTLLGPHKIEKHIKNMLHSHGSLDVADQHYDKFGYFHEKRAAMMIWNEVLERILKENQPMVRR